jgi:hypothetical protein
MPELQQECLITMAELMKHMRPTIRKRAIACLSIASVTLTDSSSLLAMVHNHILPMTKEHLEHQRTAVVALGQLV